MITKQTKQNKTKENTNTTPQSPHPPQPTRIAPLVFKDEWEDGVWGGRVVGVQCCGVAVHQAGLKAVKHLCNVTAVYHVKAGNHNVTLGRNGSVKSCYFFVLFIIISYFYCYLSLLLFLLFIFIVIFTSLP